MIACVQCGDTPIVGVTRNGSVPVWFCTCGFWHRAIVDDESRPKLVQLLADTVDERIVELGAE